MAKPSSSACATLSVSRRRREVEVDDVDGIVAVVRSAPARQGRRRPDGGR
jgi:hypothetical protein